MYILLFFTTVLLFYITDKISILNINKSLLMKEIKQDKINYEVKNIDAVINNNYIIPGLNGLKVSEVESYYNMHNIYNKDKLIFIETKPKISIENNKNLIINKGNYIKKGVSILVKNNKDIINYSKNINITLLVNYNNFDKNSSFEQINIDYENYDKLNKLLNKNSLNKNICIVFENIESKCLNKAVYLVKPTYEINNINIVKKDKIISGDIIMISDDLSLTNFKLLLNSIKYYDLKIYSLSKLISEKRV